MRVQRRLGGHVDHRSDVGGEIGGIANFQHIHRAFQARDQAVGGLLRQEQNAQGRAALARRAESRKNDIVDHLFALGGGVHEHGVQPAGLGDERQQRAFARRERAVDRLGRVGAAGEGDAGEIGMGDQRRAHRLAWTRQQMQHIVWQASLLEQVNGGGGNARRLFRRFGEHCVARRQRGRDLAGEDGQAENSTG